MRCIYIFLSLFGLIYSISAQDYSRLNVYQKLSEVNRYTNSDDGKILSNRGINTFFSKTLSYYISGTRDLSLYQFTTAADVVDGRFSFAYNQGVFRKQFDDRKLLAMFSFGMETDALQGVGKLWDGKNGWNDDIGINYKISVPIKAGVCFDKANKPAQLRHMRAERRDILNEIGSNIQDDMDEFSIWYTTNAMSSERREEKLTKFIKDTNKKYEEEYFTKEVEAFEEGGKKNYNSSYLIWGSLYGYTPFTVKKYDHINTLQDTAIGEHKMYRFYFNADLNFLLEHPKIGSLVFRVGYEGRITNEIVAESESVEQIDRSELSLLVPATDTLLLANIDKKEPYLGKVDNVYLNSFNLQLTVFPKMFKYVGFNFLFQPVINLKGNTKYESKFVFGLPLSIPTGEKRVNFEPQLVLNDVLGEARPNKSQIEKLSVQIKVGLPLGSLIYNQ